MERGSGGVGMERGRRDKERGWREGVGMERGSGEERGRGSGRDGERE